MQNKKTWKKLAGWAGVLLFWLLVWQLAYRAVGRDLLLASPLAVFQRIVELGATAEFWRIIGTSFFRIMAGFLLGLVVGSLLGAVTFRSRAIYRLVQLPMSIVKATRWLRSLF